MSNDLQIKFQIHGQNYEVNLSSQKDNVDAGYELKGDEEAIQLVKKCLDQLPQNPNENLIQTAKELKGRLWLAGAKEVELSTNDVHKIGLKNLANRDMDIHKAIDEVCVLFEKHYVFPEVAKECSKYLKQQLLNGAYDSISDPETFEQAITSDLRRITEDKHVTFECNLVWESWVQDTSPAQEHYPIPQLTDEFAYKAPSNIGWMGKKETSFPYEIKSGLLETDPKIGYIDLRIFGIAKETDEPDMQKDVAARRQAIVDAVQNIKKAESVIIDLRNNGGGDPFAVQLMCSLFMDEGFPLNQIEWRNDDSTNAEAFNTLTHQELAFDKRLVEPPVFILIGPSTFSAAEEFSHDMRIMGRATIVGEPSGGGANPTRSFPVGDDFTVYIPTGRSVNPLEGSNWEGDGVIPDYMVARTEPEVPAVGALDEAIRLINDQQF